ncbi:hypothetical protein [Bifidobacterium bombi]|uniref:Uncharacterized protein n=1 Tax=Bifidobacterium bombi DSM 19703 TaxID=1341695 RepID=A0A086BNW6_9BIFI|nr:hypothetical protein [Bifidobacterium bombi]KFF30630.1 hypothetical protein BBOMB_1496 [Bifidobacterium bombi DSM 19703]
MAEDDEIRQNDDNEGEDADRQESSRSDGERRNDVSQEADGKHDGGRNGGRDGHSDHAVSGKDDAQGSKAPDVSVPYEFNIDDLFPSGVPDDLPDSTDPEGLDGSNGTTDGSNAHGAELGEGWDAESHGLSDGAAQDSGEGAIGADDDLERFEREFGGTPGDDFDDELAGLLGNKAKTAILITRLVSADLLAAFCHLADISADCLADSKGAIAVLRNLDGDAPEAAARDLTTVVQDMPAILCVNRADKLESTLYVAGKATEQKFPPPILFEFAPAFVEDLELGVCDVRELRIKGETVVDSADLDRRKAMKIIAGHIKFRKGRPNIE